MVEKKDIWRLDGCHPVSLKSSQANQTKTCKDLDLNKLNLSVQPMEIRVHIQEPDMSYICNYNNNEKGIYSGTKDGFDTQVG